MTDTESLPLAEPERDLLAARARAFAAALPDPTARQRYERLSLSVEPGNPARKLYERHGFSVVDEGAEAWTMVASL